MTETVFILLGHSVTGFGLGMAGAMLLMLAVTFQDVWKIFQ